MIILSDGPRFHPIQISYSTINHGHKMIDTYAWIKCFLLFQNWPINYDLELLDTMSNISNITLWPKHKQHFLVARPKKGGVSNLFKPFVPKKNPPNSPNFEANKLNHHN